MQIKRKGKIKVFTPPEIACCCRLSKPCMVNLGTKEIFLMKFDVGALDTTHGHQDFVWGPAGNCKIPLTKENSLLSAEISSFVNNKALEKTQRVIGKAENQVATCVKQLSPCLEGSIGYSIIPYRKRLPVGVISSQGTYLV